MRTKAATRYNSEREHSSYGIYNFFKSKGINNQEIIKEVMYAFCEKNKFNNLNAKTLEKTIVSFVSNRFQSFHAFAMKYLKENNYN